MPLLRRYKGALLGHSFVLRFKEELKKLWRQKNRTNRTPSSDELAIFACDYFKLDVKFSRIFVEMDRSYLVQDLISEIDKLADEIDILFCMSGSNDLTDPRKCPKQLANDLFSIGKYANIGKGIKQVMFGQVLVRDVCRGMDPEMFKERATSFNKELHRLCNCDKSGRLSTIALKGFWRTADQKQMRAFDFAEDGIHPGSFSNKRGTDSKSESFKKLKRNVRRAFLAGSGALYRYQKYFSCHDERMFLSYTPFVY